jgi:hypothetical protein
LQVELWFSLPVTDTSDDTPSDVLAEGEGGALDDLSNDLDAQAGHDASASTQDVAQEEREYGTDQASKVPAANYSSSERNSVQSWIIHCSNARELVTEVAKEHDAADIT